MHNVSLNDLARLIDQAIDSGNKAAIQKSIEVLDEVLECELNALGIAQINYYKANCFAAIRNIKGTDKLWDWDDLEMEKEIYFLRIAKNSISDIPFEQDGTDLRFRILTNLANALNHIGRFAEAIALWDEVLGVLPNYSMSIGNRGLALYRYGACLYDSGHRSLFFNESYHQIKRSLEIGLEEHAVEGMRCWMNHLLEIYDWERFHFKPQVESRGRSKQEKFYRTWCLNNRLFLNPLNDLWKEDVAANDILTFPSVMVKLTDFPHGTPPEFYGIYNQLKQEYVSARFVLFDAIDDSKKRLHFSDKKVKLYDMLDYRVYRLWVEKLKMAFLGAHAIFDKIAYLVNSYWELGLNVRRINYKTCWFSEGRADLGLAMPFKSSKNWALRGLYWVSKEFIGEKEKNSPLQPEAWHISEIRNHIAHKYLKVYDHYLVDAKQLRVHKGHDWEYPISDRELISQTLNLLKLVRNALIYLSLAAHNEEQRKREEVDKGLIGEFQLVEVEDKYRI
ncbi:hypothetical protein Cpar_0476 [Chlorobaculum parvum NCIB 8327]|uniref:LA2681-like HEPN domain-containing protein n=1 Tax=Chlorobaculum parvum (strain DSM 263 / NCIMB 8327) TaxID=517417 RepID=B3QLK8_CHLP8|nr:LA2681 family HEPN domain-containing protein [Chlorobaculum parvum]ACF10898.1 hypothetical protein Cpar_0476 [Chlorobaculum parvum NCIB 8327]